MFLTPKVTFISQNLELMKGDGTVGAVGTGFPHVLGNLEHLEFCNVVFQSWNITLPKMLWKLVCTHNTTKYESSPNDRRNAPLHTNHSSWHPDPPYGPMCVCAFFTFKKIKNCFARVWEREIALKCTDHTFWLIGMKYKSQAVRQPCWLARPAVAWQGVTGSPWKGRMAEVRH